MILRPTRSPLTSIGTSTGTRCTPARSVHPGTPTGSATSAPPPSTVASGRSPDGWPGSRPSRSGSTGTSSYPCCVETCCWPSGLSGGATRRCTSPPCSPACCCRSCTGCTRSRSWWMRRWPGSRSYPRRWRRAGRTWTPGCPRRGWCAALSGRRRRGLRRGGRVDVFDASLASLRPRGMLVLYGAASGPVPPVDPQRLNSAGSVFLTRPKLADYVATRDELTWRAGEVFDAIQDGSLRISIGGRYPLAEAHRAHQDLQSRRTTGKPLLLPR